MKAIHNLPFFLKKLVIVVVSGSKIRYSKAIHNYSTVLQCCVTNRSTKIWIFLWDMLLGVCREVEIWGTEQLRGNTARYRLYSRWSLPECQHSEPQLVTPYPLRPEQYPIRRNALWYNGLRSSLRRPQKIVPQKHCDFCGTIFCSTLRTISHALRKNGL